MTRASSLLLIGFLIFLSSNPVQAEEEDHTGKKTGVQSGTKHGTDDTRTVRDGKTTYVNRILKDGIQFTVRAEGEKEITYTHRFTDIVGKDVVQDGRGSLIVAHLPNQQAAAVTACENNGMRITDVSESGNSLVCSFNAADVTLRQIQNIFFATGIRYVEPNSIVSIR